MTLKKKIYLLTTVGIISSLMAGPLFAQTLSSPAKQAILIEASTGDVLFEKNSEKNAKLIGLTELMKPNKKYERNWK